MRVEYLKAVVQSTIAPALKLDVFIELRGEFKPGAAVEVAARVPNRPDDLVPDSWNRLSRPKFVAVAADGTITYAGSGNSYAVSAVIRRHAPTVYVGDGHVTFSVLGRKFATPVRMTALVYNHEIVPDTAPPVAEPVKFGTSLLYRGPKKGWKGSGLKIAPDNSVLDVIYDNVSRVNMTVRRGGKDVVEIGGETGNIFFTGERTWISVEKGTDGRPGELVGNRFLPLGFQAHYCGCGVDIDGKPHFLDTQTGERPKLRDQNGRTVATFPDDGIPYDAVIDPEDRSVVASLQDDGQNGFAWSTGNTFVPCDARALVVYQGAVLGGVGGRVMRVQRSGLSEFPPVRQTLGGSVDSMAVDGAGNLWISTSSPDALFVLPPGGVLTQVDSYPDDADGGALFRTRVDARNLLVVWGRNNKRIGNVWEVRKVEALNAVGEPKPPPAPGAEPVGGIDWSKVRWLGRGSKNYRIAADVGLKVVVTTDGTHFYMDRPLEGDCYAYVMVLRDGIYYAGPYDGVGDKPGKHEFKSHNNVTGNGKGGPYIAKSGPTSDEASNRRYLQLKKNETYWQGILSHDNKAMTPPVEVRFPI